MRKTTKKFKGSLKFRITGAGKTAREIIKGIDVSSAVKNHIGVTVEYKIPFG